VLSFLVVFCLVLAECLLVWMTPRTGGKGSRGKASGGKTGTGGKPHGTGGVSQGGTHNVGGVTYGGSAGHGVENGGTTVNTSNTTVVTGGATANSSNTTVIGTGGTSVNSSGTATLGGSGAGGTTANSSNTTVIGTGGTSVNSSGTATLGGSGAGGTTANSSDTTVAGMGGTSVGTTATTAMNFVKMWELDALEGWGIKAGTLSEPRVDATAGTTLTTELTPGIATWTVPFVEAANAAITQTAIENNFTAVNMTGKTITLKIRWVSGGIGVASDATGGFDVFIIASDADLTEGESNYVGALALADRGATAFKTFTYTVPDAAAPWEPDAVRNLSIRLDSRYWSADPQPVFDYTTAEFEVDSITY
jgi:hypothetical protein